MTTTIDELDGECRQLCTFLHRVPARPGAETVELSLGAIVAGDGCGLEATTRKVAKLVGAELLTVVDHERYRVAPALRSSVTLAEDADDAKDALLRLDDYYLQQTDRAVRVTDRRQRRYEFAGLGLAEPMASTTEAHDWYLLEADNLVATIVAAHREGRADWVIALADRLWPAFRHTRRAVDMVVVQTRAWEFAEREGLPEAIEIASRLAWGHIELREYSTALLWARRARDRANDCGEPWRESTALSMLAKALGAIGELDKAVDVQDRVLKLDRERGVSKAQLSVRMRARAELLAGGLRYEEALANASEAVGLSLAGDFEDENARARTVLARIAFDARESETALAAAKAAEALYKKHPHPVQQIDLDVLFGEIYESMADDRDHAANLGAALGLGEHPAAVESVANSLVTVGRAAFRRGKLEEALKAATVAEAQHEQSSEPVDEVALAVLFRDIYNALSVKHFTAAKAQAAARKLGANTNAAGRIARWVARTGRWLAES